jgi:hypothetical protein
VNSIGISPPPMPPPQPPASPPLPLSPPLVPGAIQTHLITVTSGAWPSEISWSLTCDSGESTSGGAPYTGSVNIVRGATCTLTMRDRFGDGWDGATITIAGLTPSVNTLTGAVRYVQLTSSHLSPPSSASSLLPSPPLWHPPDLPSPPSPPVPHPLPPPSPLPPPGACGTPARYLLMTASQGSDPEHYNGAVWTRTATYYSHVSGGASFLASMYLYFQHGEWMIGDAVGSTNVWAKVSTRTVEGLVGSTGWLDWDGSTFSSVNIAVACAYSLTTPAQQLSPLPPAPPPLPATASPMRVHRNDGIVGDVLPSFVRRRGLAAHRQLLLLREH